MILAHSPSASRVMLSILIGICAVLFSTDISGTPAHRFSPGKEQG